MSINEDQSLKPHKTNACVSTMKAGFAIVGRIEEYNERNVFFTERLLSSNFLHRAFGICLVCYNDMPWPVWLLLCSTSVVKARQSLALLMTQYFLPFSSSDVFPFYLFLLISYFRKDAHLLITTLQVLLYEE